MCITFVQSIKFIFCFWAKYLVKFSKENIYLQKKAMFENLFVYENNKKGENII